MKEKVRWKDGKFNGLEYRHDIGGGKEKVVIYDRHHSNYSSFGMHGTSGGPQRVFTRKKGCKCD